MAAASGDGAAAVCTESDLHDCHLEQLAGSAPVHRDDGGNLRILDRQREEAPRCGTVRGITGVDDLRPNRGRIWRRAE